VEQSNLICPIANLEILYLWNDGKMQVYSNLDLLHEYDFNIN